MAKKTASLGKGLEALLPSAFSIEPPSGPVPADDGRSVGMTAMIDLEKIRPNPMQPREDFDPVALEDLKKSISEKGVIQPITVRRRGAMYEIIAGERRFRASTEAGIKQIPAYILDIETDAEMLELALIENVQRENLNPIEVALGYKRLMDECELTQEEVSKKVGKDRTTVTNFLRLLKLPREIQGSLRAKTLSMGHARAILSLTNEQTQREVYLQVRDSELSVRRTEELVKKVEAGLSVSEAVLEAVEKKNAIAAGLRGSHSHSHSNDASLPAHRTDTRSGAANAPAVSVQGFNIPDDLRDEFRPRAADDGSDGSNDEHSASSASQLTPAEAALAATQAAALSKMESELRHILATQVRVRMKPSGVGTIEIEFFSSDELERIHELFTIIEREQYS
jgi:ParB family transcriptional regulator, chromosome partitioning protein